MPRIATALLRKAHSIHPLLPVLLAPCRDLVTARNELRWLRQHVDAVFATAQRRHEPQPLAAKSALLRRLVQKRASGQPLQYVLGTEYFGELELTCWPGVLIPRWVLWASLLSFSSLSW